MTTNETTGPADLAFGARQPTTVVHHAVEQRRAVLQRLDVMRQHQHIIRDFGVGRRDLERFKLLGIRFDKIERLNVRLPVGNGGREFVNDLAHASPRINRSPAATLIW